MSQEATSPGTRLCSGGIPAPVSLRPHLPRELRSASVSPLPGVTDQRTQRASPGPRGAEFTVDGQVTSVYRKEGTGSGCLWLQLPQTVVKLPTSACVGDTAGLCQD